MPASPEVICYRYSLQQSLSPGHHAELAANNSLGILDSKGKNLSKAATYIFIQDLKTMSQFYLCIHLPEKQEFTTPPQKCSLFLFFPCWGKKKIFKEENMDSLQKEGEVASSHSQAKLQLYQVGFDLSSQALAISSLPGSLSPHPITLAVTSSSLNTSLRKLSQISQLQQYNEPFSFPLQ